MLKQVIIAKITWTSGDETYYGTFNSYEDYKKWADEAKKEDGDVIEDISSDWLFKVTEDLATTE